MPGRRVAVVIAAGLTLACAGAAADPPSGDLFKILSKESKGLLGEDVHFDAQAGLWFANLGGGLSSLVNAFEDLSGDTSALTRATKSIGTGKGVVKEVGLSLELKGNQVGLNYLSDRLVEFGQDEADKQIDDPLARTLIERFIGELRPDLTALAELDAQLWIRGEYGRFRGEIDNPTAFHARNGVPFFPQRSEGWQTEYISAEVGLAATEFDSGNKTRLGVYARYRNFSRPLVLGSGETIAALHLQDGEVTAVELGILVEHTLCGSICLSLEGSMVPFTGYSVIDFGKMGWVGAPVLSLGADVQLSYPISLWDRSFISPYVGFRTELLMPVGTDFGVDLFDENAGVFKATLWNPDYFFWGPTLGLITSF